MPAMSDYDWKRLRVLNKENHNWGNPDKIERSVIIELDSFLADYHLDGKVTCGIQGTHVSDSFHYATPDKLGCALDFMLVDLRPKDLPDIFINICRYDFMGIGIYSEWKLNVNKPRSGGFHVDMRPTNIKHLWLKGWGGYEAAAMANFQKYFLD